MVAQCKSSLATHQISSSCQPQRYRSSLTAVKSFLYMFYEQIPYFSNHTMCATFLGASSTNHSAFSQSAWFYTTYTLHLKFKYTQRELFIPLLHLLLTQIHTLAHCSLTKAAGQRFSQQTLARINLTNSASSGIISLSPPQSDSFQPFNILPVL